MNLAEFDTYLTQLFKADDKLERIRPDDVCNAFKALFTDKQGTIEKAAKLDATEMITPIVKTDLPKDFTATLITQLVTQGRATNTAVNDNGLALKAVIECLGVVIQNQNAIIAAMKMQKTMVA